MLAFFVAFLLAAHAAPDPRTKGLGRSCQQNKDCKGKSQRCLHESDMNGKPTSVGFCVLPCRTLESGTTKVIPGEPLDPNAAKKDRKPPPRCPLKYQCRDAGQGVPIDMCVKE